MPEFPGLAEASEGFSGDIGNIREMIVTSRQCSLMEEKGVGATCREHDPLMEKFASRPLRLSTLENIKKHSVKGWHLKLSIRSLLSDGDIGDFLKVANSAILLRGLGMVLAFGLNIFLARSFGETHYGVYTYIFTWIIGASLILRGGFESSLQRFIPEYDVSSQSDVRDRLVGFTLMTTLTLATLLTVPGFFFIKSTGLLTSNFTIFATLFLLINYTLLEQMAGMSRACKKPLAVITSQNLIAPIIFLSLALALSTNFDMQSFGLTTILFSAGLANLAALLAITFHLYRNHLFKPVFTLKNRKEQLGWIVVSFPLLVMNVSQFALSKVDIIIIGFVASSKDIGHYIVAATLAELVTFIIYTGNRIYSPVIAEKFFKKDLAGLQVYLTKTNVVILLLSLLIAIPMAVFGKTVLGLYGQGFKDVYGPFLVLLAAKVCIVMFGPVGITLAVTGHQKIASRVVLILGGIGMLIQYGMIMKYGLMGGASANLIVTLLRSGVLSFVVWKNLSIFPTVFAAPLLRRRSLAE